MRAPLQREWEVQPPSQLKVDDFCFCVDSRLTPSNHNGTAGVSSVCETASCSAESDLQAIKTWYQTFCAEHGLLGVASTVTNTTGKVTRTVLEVPIAVIATKSSMTVVLLSTSFSTMGVMSSILPTTTATTIARSGGLSTGAKIWIGVGTTVAFLLVLLTIWRVILRR